MSAAEMQTGLSPAALQQVRWRQLFWPEEGLNTFAILDGAAVPGLLDHLYAKPRPEFACLYRGDLEPDIAAVAPYLVRLQREEAFTEWLLTEGWGKHWGMFVLARENLQGLRRHFRRFLMVRDPEGKQLYFRFYDPRVLRVFWPTCTPSELEFLFGPVTGYVCEGEKTEQTVFFSLDGPRLIVKRSGIGPRDTLGAAEALSLRGHANAPEGLRTLAIRPEQMTVLSAYIREAYIIRTQQKLTELFPDDPKVKDEAATRALIEAGIAKAGEYGLVREREVSLYIYLLQEFGPGFEKQPEKRWIERTLLDKGLEPQEKMDVIYKRLQVAAGKAG